MRQVFEQKKVPHHYATLKKNGLTFEVLINPLEAIEFKKGNLENINDALEFEGIFSDARAGEKAADLEKNFGTENISKIAEEIISNGNIQLTTEYKKNLTEQKRKEVINIICRNGIDARTKLPIPVTRIESALEQVSVNFDPFKSAKEQVNIVLEKINTLIPISFEEKKISVLVNSKYAGKISSIFNKYGKISKTEWNNEGSCKYEILIPGGMQDEFIKKTNDFSHGEAVIELR
jgi:ribosome maturation protein SDO1